MTFRRVRTNREVWKGKTIYRVSAERWTGRAEPGMIGIGLDSKGLSRIGLFRDHANEGIPLQKWARRTPFPTHQG